MLIGTPRMASPSSFLRAPANDLFDVGDGPAYERIFLKLILYFQYGFFVKSPLTNPIW
jgi:hypothetical protein